MLIAVTEIDFIGMHIQNGQYTLQPHISKSFNEFPDKLTSVKQIQQFLGLVNYMADFIPHIVKYRGPLSQLLKKNPPPWDQNHTTAVRKLKELSTALPPLQILGDGHRILQTDASHKQWGAVLFKELQGKRTPCGYKSGSFSEAEQGYHSTFKEILAVKRAIKKFQFHLIGHHFTVEMDMSTFPRMLHFQKKLLSHPQLLKWA